MHRKLKPHSIEKKEINNAPLVLKLNDQANPIEVASNHIQGWSFFGDDDLNVISKKRGNLRSGKINSLHVSPSLQRSGKNIPQNIYFNYLSLRISKVQCILSCSYPPRNFQNLIAYRQSSPKLI